MGGRTAYEDVQKADHAAWTASLTLPEYLGVLLRSYQSELVGAGVALIVVGSLRLVVG